MCPCILVHKFWHLNIYAPDLLSRGFITLSCVVESPFLPEDMAKLLLWSSLLPSTSCSLPPTPELSVFSPIHHFMSISGLGFLEEIQKTVILFRHSYNLLENPMSHFF
ncbi:hypothetical protein AAZV13_13G327201 [Glycine max]